MTVLTSTANAAKILLSAVLVHNPTVSDIPQFEHQNKPNQIATSQSQFLVQATKPKTLPVDREKNFQIFPRNTTLQEKVIGELRQWHTLNANWDGEGASSPNIKSLNEAELFVRLATKQMPIPEPMLLASGRAALYWNENSLYADIEFLGDGRIAYFVKRNEDKHKGVLNFDEQKMPAVFTALLNI